MSSRISDDAVRRATGRGWDEWDDLLRTVEGDDVWSHKQLADYIRENFDVSYWWCQTVAVEYEKLDGRRVEGQTAHARFEVGVSRTAMFAAAEGWRRLLSPRGLALWLGQGVTRLEEPGTRYRTHDGTAGELRVHKPGSHLRLTWQPEHFHEPSTLQVRATAKGMDRCVLSFHHEKLPDAETREAMRRHWRKVLTRLAGAELDRPGEPDDDRVTATE